MNGARWVSDGNSTPSALGRFSLASTSAPNNPEWSDANSIIINDTPIIYTPNASNPAPQPSDFYKLDTKYKRKFYNYNKTAWKS